jgi:hypothetical protein
MISANDILDKRYRNRFANPRINLAFSRMWFWMGRPAIGKMVLYFGLARMPAASQPGGGHREHFNYMMKSNRPFECARRAVLPIGARLSGLILSLLTLLLSCNGASAASFTYTNTDLIAAFRLAGGSSDVVMDLGPVAYYESLAPRTVITVTNVQASLLTAAFPSLNGINWSVSAAMRGNPGYPQYPLQSIWVTSPRPDISTAGLVWVRKGQFTQGTAASGIDGIGQGAVTYGLGQPASAVNTQTGVVIASSDSGSYTTLMTATGDFDGTFQGDAENLTATNFSSGGLVSRSVLYRLLPGSGGTLNVPGTEVGYFDLQSNGTMLFTAGSAPERALITAVQVSGITVNFTVPTVNSVNYRLRYTDGAGLLTPLGTWNITGTVLMGDGNTHVLQDVDPVSNARFYVVESF